MMGFANGSHAARSGQIIPEPLGFGPAILKLVDADKPPLRALFGRIPAGTFRDLPATP